jgi:hypothetical protein
MGTTMAMQDKKKGRAGISDEEKMEKHTNDHVLVNKTFLRGEPDTGVARVVLEAMGDLNVFFGSDLESEVEGDLAMTENDRMRSDEGGRRGEEDKAAAGLVECGAITWFRSKHTRGNHAR